MKVTFISDTHAKHNANTLKGGDILIYAGDFSTSGFYKKELTKFLSWMDKQPYMYKVMVAGNHDRLCETYTATNIKEMIKDYSNFYYLQDELIEIEGLKIYGTPYQPDFFEWAFNVKNPDELTNIYRKIPEDIDILITHCPPYGILDQSHYPRPQYGATGEEHLGSTELMNVLNEMKNPPRYHVFGHIHGDGGKIHKQGNTTYINAAVCDEMYKPLNKIVNLEI